MEVSNIRSEKSDATRAALIESARRLFGSASYAEVSLDQITQASGVTKGALYHHFPGGKKDLMEAVYEQVESEFTQMITDELLPSIGQDGLGPLDVMEQAIAVTREASIVPELQQRVLFDARSVLGSGQQRRIRSGHPLRLRWESIPR